VRFLQFLHILQQEGVGGVVGVGRDVVVPGLSMIPLTDGWDHSRNIKYFYILTDINI